MRQAYRAAWSGVAAWLLVAGAALGQGDGRRAVNVEKYGISTRVPVAWNLIDWSRDNKAFMLKLPQDRGSRAGYITCELGVAPESLGEVRDRLAESSRTAPVDDQRRLIDNRLEALAPPLFNGRLIEQLGERLTSTWEINLGDAGRVYETCSRVIHDGTLYTFTMSSDESHYEAYRLDFDEMLAACVFTAPETGLRRMSGGYWMQRDYRFALQLPAGWRPAFGPNDRALFFATGEAQDGITDQLLVLATRFRDVDLERLRESLPQDILKADPQAQVQCRLVPQGAVAALETIIHTRNGSVEVTTLERRFTTSTRSYEVRFTCLRSTFARRETELRRTLDTFVEVLADADGNQT